jgi:hypothetical protein
MAGDRVMMSATPRCAGAPRALGTHDGFEFVELDALRSETISRSGATGLTKKSAAPWRIAVTTVSSEELAVCTITGVADAFAGHGFEHRHAVKIGHDQVEHHDADGRIGAQQVERLRPPDCRHGCETPPCAASEVSRSCTGSSSTIRTRVIAPRGRFASAINPLIESRCAVLRQDGGGGLRGA